MKVCFFQIHSFLISEEIKKNSKYSINSIRKASNNFFASNYIMMTAADRINLDQKLLQLTLLLELEIKLKILELVFLQNMEMVALIFLQLQIV
jgi:DNA polymerase III delta subunit